MFEVLWVTLIDGKPDFAHERGRSIYDGERWVRWERVLYLTLEECEKSFMPQTEIFALGHYFKWKPQLKMSKYPFPGAHRFDYAQVCLQVEAQPPND